MRGVSGNQEKQTPPPPAPPEERDGPWLAAVGETVAREVWEDVRSGAEHFRPEQPSLPVGRLKQLVHGLLLPFHLARLLHADGVAWRRYLLVACLQVAATLTLAFVFSHSGNDFIAERVVEEAPFTEEELAAQTQATVELERRVKESARATKLAIEGKGSWQEVQRKAEAIDQAKEQLDALEAPKASSLRTRVILWAALFTVLQVAQWIVIALSRDYHDAIGRDLSLRSGVPPEDEPFTPRIRLNMPWLRKKMQRRWRSLLVFAMGMPLMWFVRWMPLFGAAAFSLLVSVWGAWWFVVFTASKSARSWDVPSPRPPWFLRGLDWLAERVPLLHWGPLPTYRSLLARSSEYIFSPAATAERLPWAFTGLALARALAVLPLAKCFLRPLMPVAAAHLLEAERATPPASTGPASLPAPLPPPAALPSAATTADQ